MEARGWGLLLVIALVIAPAVLPAAAASDQYRGTADRSPVVDREIAQYDVRAHHALPDGRSTPEFYGPLLVQTALGLTSLTRDAGNICHVTTVTDPDAGELADRRLPGCSNGDLAGYVAGEDLLLVCEFGPADSPVLQAVDPSTLGVVWSVNPAQDLGVTSDSGGPGWDCRGVAVDRVRGRILAGFSPGDIFAAEHRVASIDAATGQVLWSTQVPKAPDPLTSLDGGATFQPRGITVTDAGLVVTGARPCGVCTPQAFELVAAWMTHEGQFRGLAAAGSHVSTTGQTAADRIAAASGYAVGRGGLAGMALGGEVTLINPESSEIVATAPVEAVEPTNQLIAWPTPIWSGDDLVIALPHSLSAFDRTDLSLSWTWSQGLTWAVADMLVTTDGQLVVLVADLDADERRMVVLDGATGRLVRSLPLPGAPESPVDFQYEGQLIPVDGDRLAIKDEGRNVTVLGPTPASQQPSPEISSRTPEVGEPLVVALPEDLASQGGELVVSWGDGAVDRAPANTSLDHAYTEDGTYQVHVTHVRPDGTTATTRTSIEAGGQDQELNAFQKAFARENQDLTFGLLGLAVALGGGLITIYRRRHRLSRLERELAVLDDIRARAAEEPEQAAREIEARRRYIHEELSAGRLDDGQFAVLQLRIDRMARLQRDRLLAPFHGQLPPSLQGALDAALEDGAVGPHELDGLRRQIQAAEGLPEGSQARLLEILEIWSREPPEA